jgi:alpha-mannosidase
MWVEADCNITGGEALVRQFLVGKKTTKALLDYESDTLWLPDVFGYAAALPQILQGCGIEYFVTSKINWNDTTRFPYDTFIWRGIDGTAVKTHYIISFKEGYNGRVGPESLKEIWHEVQHKEIQSAAVKSIGEGDGGGGTLRSDLEMARRLSNLEGAPRTEWKKVSAALKEIFKNAAELPEWRGELYLELHRGTYTTQAKTKRWNRKNEYALREAEWISAIASLEKGTPYPHGKLLESWKSLLTLQFHDIIPGSSINKVYVEAEAAHEKNAALLESLAGEKRRLFCGNAAAGKGNITVFNSLSWQRSDPVTVHGTIPANVKALVSQCPRPEGTPDEKTTALHGNGCFPVQHYRDLDGKETAVFVPCLPPSGWISFSVSEDIPAIKDPAGKTPAFLYKPGTLQTPFYKVRFDKSGRITSLADADTGKEYVAPGGFFNRFISADDVPVFWEAWDIDSDWKRYINEETRLLDSEVAANGPVVFRLRQKWQIGSKSTLLQDTVFYAESRRIDFETKVDWHEQRKLLKAGFDTGIDAPQVRCEVQYGHLLRNTHRNLPHDRAKFEICAHKWISLEDTGAGIALLNDCKYGHDVSAEEAGVSMRITLLRSPTAPDEKADQGEQRFTYSLLPFALSFARSRVIPSAYELNIPAAVERGRDSGTASSAYSLFSISGDSVIAECIKTPELSSGEGDGKPDLVLRLYESLGAAEKTVLRFRRELAGAWTTDMLEKRPVKLPFKGKELSLAFHSFEIKTVLLAFK